MVLVFSPGRVNALRGTPLRSSRDPLHGSQLAAGVVAAELVLDIFPTC